MGLINEWIKKGKIDSLQRKLKNTRNEEEKIKRQLASYGIQEDRNVPDIVIDAKQTDIVKVDEVSIESVANEPGLFRPDQNVVAKVGRKSYDLSQVSPKQLYEMVVNKYHELLSVYDKVVGELYSKDYCGNAEIVQKENFNNKIRQAYHQLITSNGKLSANNVLAFLNSKMEVSVGYELEMQKKSSANERLFKTMKYKSISSFMEQPISIPQNAMKISVAIRSDIDKTNKMKNLAKICIYLFESAKYSKYESREKFYAMNQDKIDTEGYDYWDVMRNDYFFYNQTQCEVIADEVKTGNVVDKAMTKDELTTGKFAFTSVEYSKE